MSQTKVQLIKDGALAEDSILHDGDTNTKIRFPAADTVTVETGGSERLRVNDTGLGIGITPAGQLHVSSGTSGDCELIIESDTDNNQENDNPRIVFKQDGGSDQSAIGLGNNALELSNSVSSGGGIVFKTGTASGYTNAATRMTINDSGNVGIGTTSPSAALEVINTSTGRSYSVSGATELVVERNGNAQIAIIAANDSDSIIHFGDTDDENRGLIGYDHANDSMRFRTADTVRSTIDSSGRVLIGTSTSKSTSAGQYGLLNIQGGAGTTENFVAFSRNEAASAMSANDEVSNLTFTDSVGYEFARIKVLADGATGTGDTPGRLVFLTTQDGASSATERMRIDSSGKVLIGRTSGDFPLDVAGAARIGGIFYMENDQRIQWGGSNVSFIEGNDDSHILFGVAAEKMRLTANGLGIGTASPDRQLHLQGSGTAIIRLTDSDTSGENNSTVGMIEFETRDTNGPGVSANIRSEITDTTNGACNLAFSTGTPSTIGTRMLINSIGNVTMSGQACMVLTEPVNNNDPSENTPLLFGSTRVSKGGMAASNSKSRITVPITGTYLVSALISGSCITASSTDGIQLHLARNGSVFPNNAAYPINNYGSTDGDEYAFNFTIILNFSANDYLEVELTNIDASQGSVDRGYFAVTLLH